jgi:hypothetical protein
LLLLLLLLLRVGIGLLHKRNLAGSIPDGVTGFFH